MTWLTFTLAALTAWRLTVLVTADTITDGLRRRLLVRFPPRTAQVHDDLGRPATDPDRRPIMALKAHWVVELVNCAWCVGFWIAGAVMWSCYGAGIGGSWKITLLGWFAASAVVGALSDKLG